MSKPSDVTRADFDRYFVPTYAPTEFIPARGEGARVWDTADKEYIDLAGGIAVTSVGHCHPAVVKALTDQASTLWHVSNLHMTEPALRLAKKLVDATFADRVFFCNSGAEANEGALKMARRRAVNVHGEGKDEIIAFTNSFHGRTFFTVTTGGQPKYSEGFGPRPGAVTHLPFNDIDALKAAVSDKTCAIVVEPLQGEGGVNPATPEFLKAARELCDQFDALLVFDEVQTGNGRTGSLFAYEQTGVVPDILSTAKGMGNGFPIGAVLAKEEPASHMTPGTHGTTYGGNPLACAVAEAVFDIISSEDVLAGVKERGEILKTALENINRECLCFREVRGQGLLIGCELSAEFEGKAGALVGLLAKHGVLALVAGPNTLRLAPPLTISGEELAEGINRTSRAVANFVSA
ncbi:acetylornithine/succinyldiaminopimelate transaminase [Sulfuriroseicoccus oceanibius]|uniref:Acetylornithine aminotransferase n=1 Tax=Sulfuriroseicoccus oceanibius TaxID=2707525 RepID=A0A6B3LC18_9BACT|nr:acetylornithine/succinyldiaminopimelate transaminase [Sulfuriroseicoccus oceanibius]QQL45938.1 acetylornithine/succinyldiaminopimelate transaminase [Sulfuriroseicoccus oceanibius]